MTFQPIRPGNYTHSLRRKGEMEEYRDDPSGQQKCLQMGTKRKMLMAQLSGWMALRQCRIIISIMSQLQPLHNLTESLCSYFSAWLSFLLQDRTMLEQNKCIIYHIITTELTTVHSSSHTSLSCFVFLHFVCRFGSVLSNYLRFVSEFGLCSFFPGVMVSMSEHLET